MMEYKERNLGAVRLETKISLRYLMVFRENSLGNIIPVLNLEGDYAQCVDHLEVLL